MFINKIFPFLLTVIALALFGFIYLSHKIQDGMCANEIVSEKISLDLKYKAIVFIRDCGATTNYSLQVSILPKQDSLENSTGNILILDESYIDFENHKTTLEYDWKKDNSLSIQIDPKTKIYYQVDQYKDIRIQLNKIE